MPLLHPDVLRHILSFAENRTLCVCLRVNNVLFDLAGELLYSVLEVNECDWRSRFVEVVSGATRRKRNFKGRLLRHVKRLRLNGHPPCEREVVRRACHLLTNTNFQSLRLGRCIFDYGACCLNILRPRAVYLDVWNKPDWLDPYHKLCKNASAITLAVRSLSTLVSTPQYLEKIKSFDGFAHSRVLLTHRTQWDELLFDNDRSWPSWETAVDQLATLTATNLEIYYLADPVATLYIWVSSLSVNRSVHFSLEELNHSICQKLKQRGFQNIPSTPITSRADYLRLGAGAYEMEVYELKRLQESEVRYVASRSETEVTSTTELSGE